jgi:hypothetical protein
MHARKLMLTVLVGGPIAGILAGLAIDPEIQPAPEPPWRKVQPDVIFTRAGQQFVEAGPQDLDPNRAWAIRAALLARRFAADADEAPHVVAYRSDAEVMGEDAGYGAAAAEAADSANLAVRADSSAVEQDTAAQDTGPGDEQPPTETAEDGTVLRPDLG